MHCYRERLLASTLLAGMAVLAGPVAAQTGPASGDAAVPSGVATSAAAPPASETSAGEVVVTGTLIRNPNLVASAPITTVGQDEVQLRQANVAEEILRTIPGTVPSTGSAVNNGNGGASYVDLRGLGTFRNIVLLDGARLAPSNLLGRVDLNNIPLALIERVDVLTGGASTTYGADAISGVVNFITRSNFSGVDVQASHQITERGDGGILRVDATFGVNTADGKGNAVVALGYQHADPIFQGDRAFSQTYYNAFAPSQATAGSGVTVPARFNLAGAGMLQIDPASGLLVPTYASFNFNKFNSFQTPFKQYNVFAAGHYEIADGIQFYSRGLFSKNTVTTIVAASGVFGNAVTIPYSNPYLPAPARGQFCTANGLTTAQCNAAALATSPSDPNYRTFTTTLQRRVSEADRRYSNYTTKLFDYRGGFRGDITAHLKFDVNGAYGESENRQVVDNFVAASKVRDALLATNPTTCLSGNAGCVPLNIFGAEGSITPAMLAYIVAPSTTVITTSLAQAHGQVSGDFGYTTPWAAQPVSFAAGGEYRRYAASQSSDPLTRTPGELGGVANGAALNITGAYQVYEGFGEIIAPLVADKPLLHSLTLEAGARYSQYEVIASGSPSYDTTTYKVAGSWEPSRSLKLRANYQHAVRAPTIFELFSPRVTLASTNTIDPCASINAAGMRFAPAPTGNLRAVCLAQGATAANVDIINSSLNQANITSGGSLTLKPETSNSYSVGTVVTPGFLPGLTVSVDYYNIMVTQAISSFTPSDILNGCFGALSAMSATSPACLSIQRNPDTGGISGDAGTTPGLITSLSNLGRLQTDGIDLTAAYRHDFGWAKLNLSFDGNWTHHSVFQASPTSISRDCVGYYSSNCGSPGGNPVGSIQPQVSFNQRTTLTVHDVDFSLLWRFISANRYEPGLGTPFVGTLSYGPLAGTRVDFGHIPAYHYFDATVRFGVNRTLDVTIGVINMFDRKPPLTGLDIGTVSFSSGNTYPSTYDAAGRRYAVSARVRL